MNHNSNSPKLIYVLTGPTAVGKTELSMQWALDNNAEILSCDSLLVYKGMNIGTAKPDSNDLAAIKHHGINLVSVNQKYSVSEYLNYAMEAVEDIHQRGKKVLVVGGSGFYLKSFFYPVIDNLNISEDIKNSVDKIFAEKGLSGLQQKLHSLNPQGINKIDFKNPARVTNALHRCLASGKTVDQLREEFENQQSPFAHYKKRVSLLYRTRNELSERVKTRTDNMLILGLIDEVKSLIKHGIEINPSAARAIGYRDTIEHLKLNSSIEELRNSINRNTERLIKKQFTWFKNQIPIDYKYNLSVDNVKSTDLFK